MALIVNTGPSISQALLLSDGVDTVRRPTATDWSGKYSKCFERLYTVRSAASYLLFLQLLLVRPMHQQTIDCYALTYNLLYVCL